MGLLISFQSICFWVEDSKTINLSLGDLPHRFPEYATRAPLLDRKPSLLLKASLTKFSEDNIKALSADFN